MQKPERIFTGILIMFSLVLSGCSSQENKVHQKPVIDNTQSPYTKLRSIPMQDTRLTEGFWAERFELADTKMLHTLETTMLGGGSANLNRIKLAAGLEGGTDHGTAWGDGDNYKWIESMAHVYNITKDPELDQKMDEWIEIIGKAMEDEGYISTNIMHDKSKRFERVNAHELYNMGHLLTAAVIHYRATGKENFMDLARKNADFLYNQWKAEPVHMARYPWNPSVFMGLAEMYRTTRDANHFRIPEWTENPVITLSGEEFSDIPQPGTYLEIDRKWSAGDEIILDFPMPVRLMEGHPRMTNMKNKIAVMRGPVVYCLELPKQEGGEEIFRNGVFIPENIVLTPEYRSDFLGGITVLKGKALNTDEKETFVANNPQLSVNQSSSEWKEGELYRPLNPNAVSNAAEGSVEVELIPYYAWANRGLAYMDVWVPLAR